MMNYAIKVEDPIWKWTAVATELFHVVGTVPAKEDQAESVYQTSIDDSGYGNRT